MKIFRWLQEKVMGLRSMSPILPREIQQPEFSVVEKEDGRFYIPTAICCLAGCGFDEDGPFTTVAEANEYSRYLEQSGMKMDMARTCPECFRKIMADVM